MATTQIHVERFSAISSRSFEAVLSAFRTAIAHPDTDSMWSGVRVAKTAAQMEAAIQSAIGEPGLMEFTSFDHGQVVHKGREEKIPGIVRLVVGNPLIMRNMVKHVPDAGSYAPVTILIDEREDGVHLSYDRMASFLAPYGSAEALRVARDLDSKVEALLLAAAG